MRKRGGHERQCLKEKKRKRGETRKITERRTDIIKKERTV